MWYIQAVACLLKCIDTQGESLDLLCSVSEGPPPCRHRRPHMSGCSLLPPEEESGAEKEEDGCPKRPLVLRFLPATEAVHFLPPQRHGGSRVMDSICLASLVMTELRQDRLGPRSSFVSENMDGRLSR